MILNIRGDEVLASTIRCWDEAPMSGKGTESERAVFSYEGGRLG